MAPNQLRKGNQPTLLTLPGEIRNRIYRYALACDKLKVILPFVDNAELPVPWKFRSKVQRLILVDATVDDVPNIVEFNQLKFTCRHFYTETAGLELKYNNIFVTRRWTFEDEVGSQFLQFANLVKAKAHWLSGSILTLEDVCPWPSETGSGERFEGFFPDTATIIAKIASWCRDHPSVQVDITIPGFQSCGHCEMCIQTFMIMGIALSDVLRGQDLGDLLPLALFSTMVHVIEDIMNSWTGSVRASDFQVPNLRFRIAHGRFDEGTARKQIARAAEQYPDYKDIMELEWLELEWLKQARRWEEDGL
ncbi:Nn.00g108710.m01.CDS01 [Neocucurbitaria sp. VM-36]